MSRNRTSFIANSGRMRDYYQRRHAEHVRKYDGYGVNELPSWHEGAIGNEQLERNNRVNVGGDIDITEEDARRLIALAEVLKRRQE